jgi:hypothetical protein
VGSLDFGIDRHTQMVAGMGRIGAPKRPSVWDNMEFGASGRTNCKFQILNLRQIARLQISLHQLL